MSHCELAVKELEPLVDEIAHPLLPRFERRLRRRNRRGRFGRGATPPSEFKAIDFSMYPIN